MTQYQLTPEELYNVVDQAYQYHQIEGKTKEFCPTVVKDGFRYYEEYWYKTVVMGRPIESRDLQELHAYTAAFEKDTALICWHHMDLELSLTDVLATRGTAFDIRSLSLQGVARQLARQQDKFVYDGSDTPSINGLFDDAKNTSTYTATAWGSATGPYLTVQDMVDDLIGEGFFQPYALVLSETLASDLNNFISATPTTDITEGDALRKLVGGGIYIEKMTPASPNAKTVYPLPAASSNDGVALLVKPDPSNFRLIIEHPIETLVGEFDTERKAFPVSMIQAMTMQIVETGSISKHLTVDLAA